MKFLENLRARFAATADKNDESMTLTLKNYILIIAGLVVIIIGMVLMTGGGSDDPAAQHRGKGQGKTQLFQLPQGNKACTAQ